MDKIPDSQYLAEQRRVKGTDDVAKSLEEISGDLKSLLDSSRREAEDRR